MPIPFQQQSSLCDLSSRASDSVAKAPFVPLMRARVGRLAAMLLVASLAACGGSGGGDGSAGGTAVSPGGQTSTPFPLRAAYKAFIVNGYSNMQFTVSGDCYGTATQSSSSPPRDGVFFGVPAHVVTLTGALQLSNCSTGQATSLSNQYFATNSDPNVAEYSTLGVIDADGSVARFKPPLTMPLSVFAGSSDSLGTELIYADGTSDTPIGKTVQAYSVAAETDVTVQVRLTADTYDATNRLTVAQAALYRLGKFGSFELIRIEVSYPGGSGLRLLLTPK